MGPFRMFRTQPTLYEQNNARVAEQFPLKEADFRYAVMESNVSTRKDSKGSSKDQALGYDKDKQICWDYGCMTKYSSKEVLRSPWTSTPRKVQGEEQVVEVQSFPTAFQRTI